MFFLSNYQSGISSLSEKQGWLCVLKMLRNKYQVKYNTFKCLAQLIRKKRDATKS